MLEPEVHVVEAAITSLKPGDVVVCRVNHHLNDVERYKVMKFLKQKFASNQTLLLTPDMDVEVIRAEAKEE
jgi:hypothetical protein